MGYDHYRETVKARVEGRLIRVLQLLYHKYGKTFQAIFLGVDVIYTSDPVNIQAINTTEFNSFHVSPLRRPANGDWVGEGIFVSDGHVWKQARKIIMPIFRREHAADLSRLKVHVDRMFELLPGSGETVDLRPLFRRLVCQFCHSSPYLHG
jgi:cytochrome P450